jgi:hypothetical protein
MQMKEGAGEREACVCSVYTLVYTSADITRSCRYTSWPEVWPWVIYRIQRNVYMKMFYLTVHQSSTIWRCFILQCISQYDRSGLSLDWVTNGWNSLPFEYIYVRMTWLASGCILVGHIGPITALTPTSPESWSNWTAWYSIPEGSSKLLKVEGHHLPHHDYQTKWNGTVYQIYLWNSVTTVQVIHKRYYVSGTLSHSVWTCVRQSLYIISSGRSSITSVIIQFCWKLMFSCRKGLYA